MTWAFSRSLEHCSLLGKSVDGCSVVEQQVRPEQFLTYCERIYLNRETGTGVDRALYGAEQAKISVNSWNWST